MTSIRRCRVVLALVVLASLAGCYERRPVEMKIRPISSPSSSIGAPAKAPPVATLAEDKETDEKSAESAATSADPATVAPDK